MIEDWRRYRPAIWLAMLGVALTLLLSPPYVGAVFLGGGIGVAVRIWRRGRSGGSSRSARTRPPGG